jgi:ligand-binding sensor domain-containing protein
MIWAGTFGGGVCVINKKTKQFNIYSENEGLQNSTVYKIIEDDNGLLWISTNKGISRIEHGTRKVNNYNHHNGIQNNNFVHGAGIRLRNGELYFGGLEGINYFNPDYLKKNNSVPSILISDLKISNRSVAPRIKLHIP